MGVTLCIEAGYVVVNVGDGDVVERHGCPEVFVVEKSGCKLNVLVAFGAQQAKVQAACDLGLQSLHMPSKKKEESQFAGTDSPELPSKQQSQGLF